MALSEGRELDIVRVGGMLDVRRSMPEWDIGGTLITRNVIPGKSRGLSLASCDNT